MSFNKRVFLSAVIAASFVAIRIVQDNGLIKNTRIGRELSMALEEGGCFVLPAQEVGPEVKPVFAASYPGSGARMTWNLIEALTGLVTGDEWYSNGRVKDVVTVKTHWPHPTHGRNLDWSDEITRTFLLIRNPRDAIPSFHNFLYEYEKKVQHHTERAPIEEWIAWRDRNFDRQMEIWSNHLQYWMDRHRPEDRIIVPYEHLVDEFQGPLVATELNEFLGAGPGVTPIDNESVPCVWGTVVQYQKGNQTPNTRFALPKDVKFVGSYPIWPGSHRKGPKERPYTRVQLSSMVRILNQLKDKYQGESGRLIPVLELYIEEIKTTTPQEDAVLTP